MPRGRKAKGPYPVNGGEPVPEEFQMVKSLPGKTDRPVSAPKGIDEIVTNSMY